MMRINDYADAFTTSVQAEKYKYSDSEKDLRQINQVITDWIFGFDFFHYNDPKSVAGIVNDIFNNDIIRNFVLGTTSRFLMNLTEDETIELIKIVSRSITGCSTKEENECILPKEIPATTRNLLVGDYTSLGDTLNSNKFLLVPILSKVFGFEFKTPQI